MKAYLMIALVAVGCGGSSGVNITKMIGPTGGTVSHTDGTSVTIPMGALSTAANITITSINAPAPAGTVIVGPAYDFGPEGTTFASPVTITLPIETSKIPSGRTANDVLIYTAARGSTQYTVLQTGIGSGTATTETSHFTVYLPAVLAPGAVSDLGSMHDMSNSCSPSCSLTSGGCGCTQTCGTTVYSMFCSQGSSGTTGGGSVSCFCEINGQTQSATPTLDSCSDSTGLMSAFSQCLG